MLLPLHLLDDGGGLRIEHGGVRRNGLRQPDIAADHGIVADARVAAEYRRARVYHHIVLNVGMALDALDGVAVFIEREAFCAQRHTLIQLDVGADGARFADYHARAVVDEKAAADGRARVDVYACVPVRVFRHNAREDGHAACVDVVRDAEYTHGLQGRITQHDFFDRFCGRVSLKGGLNVVAQQIADNRQTFENADRETFRAAEAIGVAFVLAGAPQHAMNEVA